MFDKKKTLAAIIATGKPKAPEKKEAVESEEEELEELPEEETPMELEAAAEDVMEAITEGSAKKVASALKAFMSLC